MSMLASLETIVETIYNAETTKYSTNLNSLEFFKTKRVHRLQELHKATESTDNRTLPT